MNTSSVLLTASLATFTAALPVSLVAAEAEKKMNVLLIISDDLRADLGAYGNPLAKSPNIDRFAAKGVMFEHAYCQYPLCNPSRSSMLSGRHPTTLNLYGNRDWFGAWYPDFASLPKHFLQQGYTTLRSGKIFHGIIDDAAAWTEGGQPHRFNDQTAPTTLRAPQPITPEQDALRISRMVATDLQRPESDRWEAVTGEAVHRLGDTVVTDRAIEYLLRYRDKPDGSAPFFIAAGVSKPHSPLVAPQEFFDLYNKEDIPLPPDYAPRPTVPAGFPAASVRPNNADLFVARDATPELARDMIHAYLACISYVDWNVGRILEALEASGQADNTIVIFWSDHGFQLGEKGKWSKAGSLWEQGAHVPLIIYDPRARGNGRSSPRVVQAIDIYPTLADLCDLPIPEGLDGLSLAPLLDDPTATWEHPAYTFWSERGRGVSGAVVRDERWRYAEFYGPGHGAFLTDPVNDPHETVNLANDPQYAPVVARMSELLRSKVRGKTELNP